MAVVSPVHAHGALLQTIATQRYAGEHAQLFEGSIVLVAIEVVGAGVVGNV